MRRVAFALAALALWAGPLHAYNHPEIAWKSAASGHFVFHYYDRTEPALAPTAAIAESAYASLTRLYPYALPNRIELSLADYDDFSNGFANWTNGSIVIWVPDLRFDLRCSNTWLRDVVTHELTHILTMEKQTGFQVLDAGLRLAYLGPTSGADWVEPFARLTMYPGWFAEGLAQAGAEHEQGDCWDARRDMLLRCALLEGRELPLDAMGHFGHDGIGNEMVYNQGYAFVRHLRETLGQDVLSAIVSEGSRTGASFTTLVRRHAGRDLRALHAEWLERERGRCRRRAPAHPTPVTALWARGTFNGTPRFSPDGTRLGWLTNHPGEFAITDLVVADARTLAIVERVPYVEAAWCFSADGASVYYVRARSPNARGSYLNDLFARTLRSGRDRRLTRDARVYDVAASPDGATLAVVTFADGAFSLGTLATAGGAVSPLVRGEPGAPFAWPGFDPADPRALVFARLERGTMQLFTQRLDGAAPVPLLPSGAQCETPYWDRDGRIYFSADYDGIFNLYSVLPGGGDLRRHSDIVGGLFAPVRAPEGRLVASEYTARGFRIVRLDSSEPGAAYALPAAHDCAYGGLPRAEAGRLETRPYQAAFLRPVWEVSAAGVLLQDETMGVDANWLGIGSVGLNMFRSDALDKRDMSAGLAVGMLAARTHEAARPNRRRAAVSPRALPRVPLAARDFPGVRRSRAQTGGEFAAPEPGASLWRMAAWQRMTAAGGGADSTSPRLVGAAIVQPQFRYQSTEFAPTLGVGADALFLYVLPMFVTLAPSAAWTLGREVNAGVSPIAIAVPLGLAASLDVPLWLQWFHAGHPERHFRYTLRGGRVLTAQIEPFAASAVQIDSSADVSASLEAMRGISTAVSYEQGVRLGGSMSLVPSLTLAHAALGRRGEDPLGALDDSASAFVSARPGLAFVFPVLRSVRRGSALYLDALYGSLYYEGGFDASGGFLAHASGADLSALTAGRGRRGDARVRHTVGLRLTAGTSKSYVFDRMLTLAAGYEIVERKGSVRLGAGF